MLAVAVHLDHVVVPVLEREDEAGLNRAADAEVEGQPEHPRSGVASELAVASVEPSSITTTSKRGTCLRRDAITDAIVSASL